MGLTLIVDASIYGVSLGLKDSHSGKELIWWESILERNGSAKMLSQLMNKGMHATNRQVQDIEHIVVSCGPGTFTGIKVGIAWAQGLLAGLSTGTIAAYSGIESAVSFLAKENSYVEFSALLPVTKTHGFLIQYLSGQSVSSLVHIENDVGQKQLLEVLKGNICIINNWDQMHGFLEQNQIDFERLEWSEVMRGSIEGVHRQMISWCHSRFTRSVVEPNYMRKSTAEEQLEQKRRKERGN